MRDKANTCKRIDRGVMSDVPHFQALVRLPSFALKHDKTMDNKTPATNAEATASNIIKHKVTYEGTHAPKSAKPRFEAQVGNDSTRHLLFHCDF